MSKWATTTAVGWQDPRWSSVERYGVLSYVHSGHYPSDEDRPGMVDMATMPPWCVPGLSEDDMPDDVSAPWLRIATATWDDERREPVWNRAVVLSPDAARALAGILLAWADAAHVEPPIS